MTANIVFVILYFIFAPLVGGLFAGLDRVVSARMQGRVGPPVFQPFYDVFKLLGKQNFTVNRFHSYYLVCYLLFAVLNGAQLYLACLFNADDILFVIFTLTLADIFLVMAAYSAGSPYSFIGAERELFQMLVAEPLLLITAFGFYMATKSFDVVKIYSADHMLFLSLPGIFIGFVFVLTIKFRKSPFDLATSHHAHQELVKGLTTEFSGPTLALFEIAHWFEVVMLLGIVFLFFASSPLLGLIITVLTYFATILIDNTYARFKLHLTFEVAWIATLILGGGNLMVLYFLKLVNG